METIIYDNIIENIKLRLGYKEEVTISRDELNHLLKTAKKEGVLPRDNHNNYFKNT